MSAFFGERRHLITGLTAGLNVGAGQSLLIAFCYSLYPSAPFAFFQNTGDFLEARILRFSPEMWIQKGDFSR